MSLCQFCKVSIAVLMLLLLGCGAYPNAISAGYTGPQVSMVVPQSDGEGTNREIGVLFNGPMDPSTINASTFLVAGATGKVTYDVINHIGGFWPPPDPATNVTYKATITVGAKGIDGTPLLKPFNFSFLTRGSTDTSAPYVIAVNLVAGATGVPQTQKILITFDEQMSSGTITLTTVFLVPVLNPVPPGVLASVIYDVTTQMATLTPSASLAPCTKYLIEATAGAQDAGGVALNPFQQVFTTGPCEVSGTQPIILCPSVGQISVLAGSTVTNTGSSVITGEVAVSPGSAVTGFPPGSASTIHKADGPAALAQAALTAAYVDAADRSGSASVAGDLVGLTLTPGIYKSTSSLANSGAFTLDAKGDPSAIFIFQIASKLVTGSGSHIVLANGANPCNVFWQVGSSATLGTNSVFEGNIMALDSIALATGAKLDGRALARNGAVTLDTNAVSGCSCP